MQIDKNKPWYWICYGQSKNSIAFNCKEATRSEIVAYAIVAYRNYSEKVGKWFVRKDFEHPDRDIKQFKCPECETLMSQNELNQTWDWAGPHCNNCGCTGMTMFAAVQEHAPVISGKQ
jgi:hypothetical protein